MYTIKLTQENFISKSSYVFEIRSEHAPGRRTIPNSNTQSDKCLDSNASRMQILSIKTYT